jgi:Protein of unknown function (DUF2911)
MKRSVVFTLLVVSLSAITAVAQKPSPAATAEGTIDGVTVKIAYSQPSARGRKVIGELVPYGKIWRTGANETTSIEFSGPVKLEGKDLAKGKYALFTVPGENEWIIVINKTIAYGHFSYSEAEDVLRVKVKPTKTASFVETFNIVVEKNKVVMKWENTQVAFGVTKP